MIQLIRHSPIMNRFKNTPGDQVLTHNEQFRKHPMAHLELLNAIKEFWWGVLVTYFIHP